MQSPSTGIILNDSMDGFSTSKQNNYGLRPSPNNFIEPGKRAKSSMCPVIVLDKNNDAVLVMGSAGGPKITTAVAYVCTNFSTIYHTNYGSNVMFLGFGNAYVVESILTRFDFSKEATSPIIPNGSFMRTGF